MAVIIKALGAGTITTTGTTDLFPALGTNKSALVHNVRLVNTTAASTTAMNLYVVPSGGTARRIYKKDFFLAANVLQLIDDAVTLGTGDKIQVNISTGATPSLAYMVSGVERDT